MPPYRVVSQSFNAQRVRNGSSVPNWKGKIRNHEDATSGFTGLYDTLTVNGSVGAVLKFSVNNVGDWSVNGPIVIEERLQGGFNAYYALTQPFTGTGWVGNADGRASNKFLQAVRQTQTQFSAPQFIGELRETQRMLRLPAAALWENILLYELKLLHYKRRSLRNWIYSIPDLWLEYSFGWKPLMMDIDDAFQNLADMTDRTHVVHVSKAGVDNRHVSDSTFDYLPSNFNYLRIKIRRLKIEEAIVRYRGDVTVQAETTFADKAARWGFDPAGFVATAWELLPWSFLVDYFTTIGDFIEASGARTSSLRWVCKTIRSKARDFCQYELNSDSTLSAIPKGSRVACYSTEQSTANTVFERRSITRQKGQVPVPDLSIRWEGPKWGQIANMSALFGSFNANLHHQRPRRRNYRL